MRKAISGILTALMLISLSSCSVTEWINEHKNKIFPAVETPGHIEEISEKPNIINAGIFDFDTFNPLITESESVKEAMELVYEPLFTFDENLRLVPVIAKDYTVSSDGRTILINIRENIKWHDGTMLTAEDVAYTFKVIRRGDTKYTSVFENIADYLMIGDYSIRIVLKEAVPMFESILTFPIVKYNTPMSVDKNYKPNGTGPFCYGAKSSVDEVYFGAFEEYHGGRAAIDAMYVNFVPSKNQYMTMLEASEIDFASSEIIDLTEYMPKGNLSLYDYTTNKMTFLGFNMKNELFSGKNTRKGITELISKEELVDTVIFSRGVASDIAINPKSYLYYDDQNNFDSNETEANNRLGDDGWGPDSDGTYIRRVNGKKQKLAVKILVEDGNKELVNTAEAIAEQLKKFAIKTTVDKQPREIYEQRIKDKTYDVFVGEIEIGSNNDLTPLTKAEDNCFGYENGALKTLNVQIGMTRDEEEMKVLHKQYCDILLEDMPFCVLYYKNGSVLMSASVKTEIKPVSEWKYKDSALWRVR